MGDAGSSGLGVVHVRAFRAEATEGARDSVAAVRITFEQKGTAFSWTAAGARAFNAL
jgi:hypothetical protein